MCIAARACSNDWRNQNLALPWVLLKMAPPDLWRMPPASLWRPPPRAPQVPAGCCSWRRLLPASGSGRLAPRSGCTPRRGRPEVLVRDGRGKEVSGGGHVRGHVKESRHQVWGSRASSGPALSALHCPCHPPTQSIKTQSTISPSTAPLQPVAPQMRRLTNPPPPHPPRPLPMLRAHTRRSRCRPGRSHTPPRICVRCRGRREGRPEMC